MNQTSIRTLAAPALAVALLAAAADAAAQQRVQLPAQDRALPGAPTPVFSIGTEEGQSWEMLSRVTTAVFDRNDNLYVLDGGNARVLVFDRGGRFVRQLGKKGSGPGELQAPTGLALTSDGNVAVMDLAHRNVTLYGTDGAFRRTVALDPEAGMPMNIQAHPSGGVVTVARPSPFAQGGPPAPNAPRKQSFNRIPLTENGRTTTLFQVAELASTSASSSPDGSRRQFRISQRIFGPQTYWSVLPNGGIAVSSSAPYRIEVADAGGRLSRIITRPIPLRRPTEREKEEARKRAVENINSGAGMRIVVGGPGGGGGRGGGGAGEMSESQRRQEAISSLEFADTVAAVRGLTLAPTGKLWVERSGSNWNEPGPIDVITAEGQYLGTITGQRRPVAISASGRAAYIETDDVGVERVVVRQLPAAWR